MKSNKAPYIPFGCKFSANLRTTCNWEIFIARIIFLFFVLTTVPLTDLHCQEDETEFGLQISNFMGAGFSLYDQIDKKWSGGFEFGMMSPNFILPPYPDNFTNIAISFSYRLFPKTSLKMGWYFGGFKFKDYKNELGFASSPYVFINNYLYKNKIQLEFGVLVLYPEKISIYKNTGGVKTTLASMNRNLNFPYPCITIRVPVAHFSNNIDAE